MPTGTRKSCLMKKTGDKKSHDTVPLGLFSSIRKLPLKLFWPIRTLTLGMLSPSRKLTLELNFNLVLSPFWGNLILEAVFNSTVVQKLCKFLFTVEAFSTGTLLRSGFWLFFSSRYLFHLEYTKMLMRGHMDISKQSWIFGTEVDIWHGSGYLAQKWIFGIEVDIWHRSGYLAKKWIFCR